MAARTRAPVPELLTVEETAKILRLSKPTVYRMVDDRVLKSYDFPGKRGKRYVRIFLDSLLEHIDSVTREARRPRKGQKGY